MNQPDKLWDNVVAGTLAIICGALFVLLVQGLR
jgi:hypothetical protein